MVWETVQLWCRDLWLWTWNISQTRQIFHSRWKGNVLKPDKIFLLSWKWLDGACITCKSMVSWSNHFLRIFGNGRSRWSIIAKRWSYPTFIICCLQNIIIWAKVICYFLINRFLKYGSRFSWIKWISMNRCSKQMNWLDNSSILWIFCKYLNSR